MRPPTSSRPKRPVCAGWRKQRRTADRTCPRVIASPRREIEFERIDVGPWTSQADETFGRALAALHRTGAPRSARPPTATSVPFRSTTPRTDDWPDVLRHASARAVPATSDRRGSMPDGAAAALRPPLRPHRRASPVLPEPPCSHPRRPVARQRARRPTTAHLGRRPGRPRRPPRDRPRHDAPLRRLRRALLRRLRRGVPAGARATRTGSRSTNSIPCSSTRCCSGAVTEPTRCALARRYVG